MRVRDRYLEQLDESMQEVLAAIQVTTIGRVISASSCVFLFLSLPFPTPLYLHVSSCVCIRECSLAHLSAFARPCAQQYVGKYQSCMVMSGRLIVHAPVCVSVALRLWSLCACVSVSVFLCLCIGGALCLSRPSFSVSSCYTRCTGACTDNPTCAHSLCR